MECSDHVERSNQICIGAITCGEKRSQPIQGIGCLPVQGKQAPTRIQAATVSGLDSRRCAAAHWQAEATNSESVSLSKAWKLLRRRLAAARCPPASPAPD